jgi:hypothetical protein
METLAQAARPSRLGGVARALFPIAVAIAVIVFLVVRFTGQGVEALPPQAPPPTVNADPKALTPEARAVAKTFVTTAVARKDVGSSWALLDPGYDGKSEYTKTTWAKGDIPVVPAGYPFRADGVKLSVKAVYPGSLLLTVLVLPSNSARAKTFDLSLKRHGSGARARWLVDYWMTDYKAGFRDQAK